MKDGAVACAEPFRQYIYCELVAESGKLLSLLDDLPVYGIESISISGNDGT